MSSDKPLQEEEASGMTSSSSCSTKSLAPTAHKDEAKRAEVKRLIEQYFHQLTNGCGDSECTNEFCASSRFFSLPNIDNNTAATKALELVRARSHLCARKVPRGNSEETEPPGNSVGEFQRGNTEGTSESGGHHRVAFASVADRIRPAVTTAILRATTQENRTRSNNAATSKEGVVEGANAPRPSQGSHSGMDGVVASTKEGHSLMESVGVTGLQPVSSSSSLVAIEPEKTPRKIEYLSEKRLREVIETCELEGAWQKLIHLIGYVFHDPDALMNSFLHEVEPYQAQTKEEIRSMEVDQDKDRDDEAISSEDEEKEEGCEDMEISSFLATGEASPLSDNPPGAYTLEDGFSGAIGGIGLSMHDDENPASHAAVTVDLDSVHRAFTRLFSIPDVPFQGALIHAITSLSRTLETDLHSYREYSRRSDYVNIYLIVMEIPHLDRLEYLERATPQFCKTLGQLSVELQAKLARVWSQYDADRLREMVQRLQQLITVRIVSSNAWSRNNLVNDDDVITSAAKILKILYYASIAGGRMDPPDVIAFEQDQKDDDSGSLEHLLPGATSKEERFTPPREDLLAHALNVKVIDCRQPLVDPEEFINESLSDVLEMDKDYTNYRATADLLQTDDRRIVERRMLDGTTKFSFMLHSFLLTMSVKNMGMFYDNRIRMLNERRQSVFQSMIHGNHQMPYLRLRIRRDHIIDDSLINLEMIAMDNPQDLKKQLFVEFEGEQAIDEGGVSKEFFQLVVEEIFNQDIGMFTFSEDTNTFWFNSTSFENDGQYMLIGIVLGLAIYNNVILDVHFPMVVYRKLMGKTGVFEDLHTSHPVIARSLKHLLEYEGDVEEAFSQPFSVGTVDVFGVSHVHHLKENGDEILVTNETRHEFVNLYANFLLNKSVEKQFRAFQRGFQMVVEESPLAMLFTPGEIELLICGSQNFDFLALENAAEYDGGFTADSSAIKYFWEVMHELEVEQKRQLLQFATGSDRVPIGGLSKLKLIIARNGPDSERLPTAHTCFNVLLLPDYATKEKLKERLLKAITYSKGFGML